MLNLHRIWQGPDISAPRIASTLSYIHRRCSGMVPDIVSQIVRQRPIGMLKPSYRGASTSVATWHVNDAAPHRHKAQACRGRVVALASLSMFGCRT